MKGPYQTPLNRREFPGLVCGKGMTKQSFKDECDIHTIIERFKETGQVPASAVEGHHGDFTEVTDYHGAMLMVRKAQEMFEALPAGVRDRFQNDPGSFVSFVEDPDNAEALVEMGLAVAVEPTGEQLGAEGPPAPTGAGNAASGLAEGSEGDPGLQGDE